ncbi:MAG: DUF255 domain-containing protein [Saprospiraceae bacterium]|nr:DUF255 domain-containing protein [Saprospiraceae bacterium]
MKNLFFALLSIVFILSSFTLSIQDEKEKINWLTWEEAMALDNENDKKYFVDLYTEWCGYCKKMDRTTFKDKEVIKYVNQHFIPIKLDAEQKEAIQYKGYEFTHKKDVGRRGMHEMAIALLEGVQRVGYPTYVYLDSAQNRITISPGFKQSREMLMELNFIAGDHYKTTKFDDFAKNYN